MIVINAEMERKQTEAAWPILGTTKRKKNTSYEPIISQLLTATMQRSVKNQSDTSSFGYKKQVSRPDMFAINHQSQFLSG